MGLRDSIKTWCADLLSMLYPDCCEVCGTRLVRGEKVICTECDLKMPRCNIHTQDFNAIHQRLAGHTLIDRAAGYFYYYRSSPYTRPILAAKYNGRPRIGRILANRFAREIADDGFFTGIDIIIPVPLHRLKRLKRGYNQTEQISRGISEATGIPVGDNLVAVRSHSTQTRLSAFERWKNSLDTYSVSNPEELNGKHVLIVDDVITTGSTMLACCDSIAEAAQPTAISVLALGVTNLQ